MEGLSIIIPVFNKIATTLSCVLAISEDNKESDFEIVIVDNGSSDDTQKVFSKMSDQLTYIRNEKNLGVSRALNIGAAAARFNTLCFMHNDVIVHKKNWTSSVNEFINSHSNAGVVGLYGAKTVREDGSFRGKSIVHSKRDKPSMSKPFETVAVVDGMLLVMKKPVFEKVGGFSDEFIVHFYDKDISLKAMTGNFVNYVLNVPFEHTCAATRTDIKDDDFIRDEAKNTFLKIWAGMLPVDVTTWREKIRYVGKGKRAD